MKKYLVAFTYHTHQDWVVSQLTDEEIGNESTGLFIGASSEEDALQWGREIAIGFTSYLNDGLEDAWPGPDHECWIADPASCEWTDALGFLQSINVGEFPNYDHMTWSAYVEWLEQYGAYDT